MSTKKVEIKKLLVGQKVAIANDSRIATVVRQAGSFGGFSKWILLLDGREITLLRNQIGVLVHGRWVFGAANKI